MNRARLQCSGIKKRKNPSRKNDVVMLFWDSNSRAQIKGELGCGVLVKTRIRSYMRCGMMLQ